MSLENILKEIKTLIPLSEEDTDSGPVETLSGRRGRKNQAIESLRRLKREYRNDLMRSALFIVVVGSYRKEFEELSTTNPKIGLFSSNPEEFYNDLSNRVPQALYQGKESVSNIFDVLGRHLEDKANELDIIGYPQLIFKESYVSTLSTQEDFKRLVKRAVNEQMGAEVVGVQAVNSILDGAIKKNHISKTTPIVLSTDDNKLAADLMRDLDRLTNRVFLIQAGETDIKIEGDNILKLEEVNQNTIKAALATINKAIKK